MRGLLFHPWSYVLRVISVIFNEKPNGKPAFLDFAPDFFFFFWNFLPVAKFKNTGFVAFRLPDKGPRCPELSSADYFVENLPNTHRPPSFLRGPLASLESPWRDLKIILKESS